MVSRRSARIKSTSVLKKLKKKLGSKSKSSVGVQDVNLKRTASNSQINTASEHIRTRRSSTTETKQKENKRSEILSRKTRNTAHQEDARVKSCTVLAVKLKYPYVGKTTSVKLNSRSTNKTSDSSKALSRTTAKSSEIDLDVQDVSRKSSRMRKPTSKELKSVLVSTDKESVSKKRNSEVSPQKLSNKSVKQQISNEISIPGHKIKDDMECVQCGVTPSQLFVKDSKHNTVCCFCSLVRPPQELKALLQLLKLDCCLKILNQKNQKALESNSSPLRKRKMNEHPLHADHKSATSSRNSDGRSLRERNSVRNQKEQNNQNSSKEQKKSAGQQKGNASINLNKRSSSAKSPNSTAVSSTRISARLMQRAFPRIRPSTKANKQTLSSIKDIHKNLKRKISPQSTQTPTKRRKLSENVEVKKKIARDHACSSCNSTFAMQWKLKLHELTHTDKSYPNIVLRHAEVENTSDVTNQNVEGECSEPMDCDPSSENAGDKDNLNVEVSKIAVQQIHSTLGPQEGKTALDNETSNEDGDNLEHSEVLKQGNEVKSTLEDEETNNKDSSSSSSDVQKTKISDASADGENTEVQELDKVDSHDVTTNSDTPSDKDNAEVNGESDANPTFSDATDQSTKPNEDVINKKSDLSSNFEDTNSPGTLEVEKDKEQDEINSPSEPAYKTIEEAKENEQSVEKSKAFDGVSAEDVALDQLEIQNTLGEAAEQNENNEELEETGTSIKANEETEPHEVSDTNEEEHADEENEERSNEINGDAAGEETEMHEDDEVVESSEMNQNCGKENVSVENNSDLGEQKDDENLVTEEESNSENIADECRSEDEETECKSKHSDHGDQPEVDVSESNEIKVNGIVTNDDDDGSKSTSESQSADHPETVVNHTTDNIHSQHPVDEKMTELYNQMNMMFEGSAVGENKAAKITEKKLPDCQLENGDNASVSDDQQK